MVGDNAVEAERIGSLHDVKSLDARIDADDEFDAIAAACLTTSAFIP